MRGTEWVRPFVQGLSLTTGVLVLYLVDVNGGATVPHARALAFAALLLGQGLMVLVERSPGAPVWSKSLRDNRALPWVLASIPATLVAAVYVPPLAHLVTFAALPVPDWAIAIGVAAGATLWLEPFKRKWTRGKADPSSGTIAPSASAVSSVSEPASRTASGWVEPSVNEDAEEFAGEEQSGSGPGRGRCRQP